jgi:hypothetical protein
MRKAAMLLLTLMVCSSIVFLPISSAAPALSVPEFSLKVTQDTYDHPGIYRFDPYTGENVTVAEPYKDVLKHLIVTINNQQFTPYTDPDGHQIELCYSVRAKGNYTDSWDNDNAYDSFTKQNTDSDYTIVEYNVNDTSPNTRIDFQVSAVAGYYFERDTYGIINRYVTDFSTVESSQWSETQTITIGEPANQTVFGLNYVTFVLLVVFVLAVALSAFTLYTRKTRKLEP